MRAFFGEFDRLSLGVLLIGASIGAVWLVAMNLGMLLATIAITVGCVTLIIRHRWIEIGLLMIAIGLVVVVGYGIIGSPPVRPPSVDPVTGGTTVPPEVFGPGMAGLILIGGFGLTAGGGDLGPMGGPASRTARPPSPEATGAPDPRRVSQA